MQNTGGPRALRFVDRPTPTWGPHELLLRVRYASLNYRDLAIARGEYGSYTLPLVLGSDAVAEVVAVGDGVSRFALGDRVCPADTPDWISGTPEEAALRRRLGGPLDGVFSEFMLVSEQAAVAAPAHLSDEEAATLAGAGVTAWQALHVAGTLRPGDTVVVQGTGGVSLFALQIALCSGARVVVLSRSAAKLERVLRLGAAHGIDTSSQPDWELVVLELTEGRGADVVLDVIGGSALARSIAATRIGGRLVLLGFLEGNTATIDLGRLIRRSITLSTSSGRSARASRPSIGRSPPATFTRWSTACSISPRRSQPSNTSEVERRSAKSS